MMSVKSRPKLETVNSNKVVGAKLRATTTEGFPVKGLAKKFIYLRLGDSEESHNTVQHSKTCENKSTLFDG